MDGVARPRPVRRPVLPPGPLAELKDALHELYLRAAPVTVAGLHQRILELAAGEEVSDPTATPAKDTIHAVLADPVLPADVRNVVAVAAALLHPRAVPGVVPEVRGHPDVERIRGLWERAAARHRPPGKPVADVGPADLEVRRAGPDLPAYIVRAHDRELTDLVAAALGPQARSGIAVLVSDSTSGKTRALYEALHRPVGRRSLARWRVWPAQNPLPAEQFRVELAAVEPRTVIWLNEAQRYLLEPDQATATAIAATLRALLADPARGPLLVLGTLWPQYRDQVMRQAPAGEADRHADARALLTGTTLRVPDRFTGDDLAAARASTDTRLRAAIEAEDRAAGGHSGRAAVTQYLAGVPELADYHAHASTPALAVLHAAMDVRRLGHGEWVPTALLHHAAPAYLDEQEQTQHLDEGWFERALVELTALRGAGARALQWPPALPGAGTDRLRLHDYLDQHARRSRVYVVPPQGFWDAVRDHAATDEDRFRLGLAAHDRHRLRIADALWRRAADHAGAQVMLAVAENTGSAESERLLCSAAAAGHPYALSRLIFLREEAGEHAEAERLAMRAAEAGSTAPLFQLLAVWQRHGGWAAAEEYASRCAEAGYRGVLTTLLRTRLQENQFRDVELLHRAADRGDQTAQCRLVVLHEAAGAHAAAEQVALSAKGAGPVVELAALREKAGDLAGAEKLLRHSAEAGHGDAMVRLAWLRDQAGDPEEAEELAQAAQVAGERHAVNRLAVQRLRAGDTEGSERLLLWGAEAGNPYALARLARLREEAGDQAAAEELAFRAVAAGHPMVNMIGNDGYSYRAAGGVGMPAPVVQLIEPRQRAGDTEGAERLYRRLVEDGNAYAMAMFATTRPPAEAEELAFRAAAAGYPYALTMSGDEAVLRRGADAGYVEVLLHHAELRPDLAPAMHRRAADAGRPHWLVERGGLRYGLEADGTPSPRW